MGKRTFEDVKKYVEWQSQGIYEPMMAGAEEQPQASNFKHKSELFIQFYLKGSENSDYRGIIKKLTEAT